MVDQDNQYEFHEIEKQTNICLPNGKLNPDAIGWSRKPIFLSNLKGNIFRKKLWNYWCITGPEGMFSITISDIDYAGMIFAYYLDYATGKFEEASEIIPLARGIHLPDHPRSSVEFENENLKIEFKVTEYSTETRINVHWKNFHGKSLKAEFIVSSPIEMESLNVVVPWSDTQFQYTSKQNCLPTKGFFILEKDGLSMKKTFDEGSFACLDFGRGVWPYKASWNWGCFSAMIEQNCVGLNMGGKWTDGTGISENGILIDGILTKIQEPIEWTYNRKNFKDEWSMKTLNSDILDVKFEPFFERKAVTNLGIIYSEVHQCFGRYSGFIRTKTNTIKIENVVGWAEEHIARW
jgi:hypothetical protein